MKAFIYGFIVLQVLFIILWLLGVMRFVIMLVPVITVIAGALFAVLIIGLIMLDE